MKSEAKAKKKQLPISFIEQRHCWHGTTSEDTTFDCHKSAIPGRLLCQNHAKQKNQLDRRRVKNKVARASRRMHR